MASGPAPPPRLLRIGRRDWTNAIEKAIKIVKGITNSHLTGGMM